MPRVRTGSAYEKGGRIYLAIRLRSGKRWARPWDGGNAGDPVDLARAKGAAAELQRQYDAGEWDPEARAAPADPGETVRAWCGRWLAARRAAGLVSVDDDEGRLDNHVLPVVGGDPIASLPSARVEDVRDALDRKARAGEISTATAAKVWGLVTKMFADAQNAKDRSLRARADNPCANVLPPDRAPERVGPVVYPAEWLLLADCRRAPLRWRRLFALALYTYARRAEIEALECESVDLARDTILIHQAVDRDGNIKPVKTGLVRRIPIEPTLRPLLVAMLAEAGGKGRLVPSMPPPEDCAAYLRTCLGYARCDRAELFADDKTRRPLSFHDLRASGITWMAVRGDAPLAIQQRAGHTTFATTQGYVRLAETLGRVGEVFPALPTELLGTPRGASKSGRSATDWLPSPTQSPRSLATSEGFSLATPTGLEGDTAGAAGATSRLSETVSSDGRQSESGGDTSNHAIGYPVAARGEVHAYDWGDRARLAEMEAADVEVNAPGGAS